MNHGLMIARSMDWKAMTKVRSSVFFRPGMIVCPYRPNTPATSPIEIVAAINVSARSPSIAAD
jgi:hypothetical protein